MKYQVALKTGGLEYLGEGETIYDALSNLPLDWTQIKLKGTLIVSEGDKTHEKNFFVKPLRMIFANKGRRMGVARQFQYFLDR